MRLRYLRHVVVSKRSTNCEKSCGKSCDQSCVQLVEQSGAQWSTVEHRQHHGHLRLHRNQGGPWFRLCCRSMSFVNWLYVLLKRSQGTIFRSCHQTGKCGKCKSKVFLVLWFLVLTGDLRTLYGQTKMGHWMGHGWTGRICARPSISRKQSQKMPTVFACLSCVTGVVCWFASLLVLHSANAAASTRYLIAQMALSSGMMDEGFGA